MRDAVRGSSDLARGFASPQCTR